MAKNQKNQGFAAIRDVVSSSRFRESRLDGDIYYDDFKVIGFEEFQNIPMGVNTGIDILVY